jgi:predicted sulfurtransferase
MAVKGLIVGKILLYYKYVAIKEPEAIATWQKQLCAKLGLTGRIIIATEGINGTVGGSIEATDAYQATMKEHPLFGGIDWKTAEGDQDYFPRMRVVVKNEIVHLGVDPEKLTVKDGGKHLTPDQVHELLNNAPDDLVILDTRNNYESRIGTFKGSLTPDIETFRQLPEYIDKHLDQFKDKKVLMHCTGGVRCERATAYLQQKGVSKEIYQVEGGIHRYIEKYPDGHFRGSNYVFDSRIAHRTNNDILSNCDICTTTPSDFYTNCMNALCNKQFLVCPDCKDQFKESCSQTCYDLVESGKVSVRKKPLRPHLTKE